jgi:platelet-activating factor acetylhydrolase IB subunit alpha
MIAYLSANNLAETASALRAELNLGEDVFDAAVAKKYETLLEKKWTGVVRLQKKACLRVLHSVYQTCPLVTVISNRHMITDNGPRVPKRGTTI